MRATLINSIIIIIKIYNFMILAKSATDIYRGSRGNLRTTREKTSFYKYDYFINITEIHIIHLHYSHSTDLANSITHGIWEWYYEVIRLEIQSSITLSADISLGESLLIRYGPSVAPVYSISLFNGFLLFLPTILTHIHPSLL